MKRKTPALKFAVCINNADYAASLTVRVIYRVLTDKAATADGDVRVIDESGEDYLYPADRFVFVELPTAVEEALFGV